MVYIFFIVPETKNKTFMEINRIMAKRNKVEIQEEKEELEDFRTVPGGQAEKKEIFSSGLWPSPVFGLAQMFFRICSAGEQIYRFIVSHQSSLGPSANFQQQEFPVKPLFPESVVTIISRTILFHGIATAKANYPFLVFVTGKGQHPQPSSVAYVILYVPVCPDWDISGDRSHHLGWFWSAECPIFLWGTAIYMFEGPVWVMPGLRWSGLERASVVLRYFVRWAANGINPVSPCPSFVCFKEQQNWKCTSLQSHPHAALPTLSFKSNLVLSCCRWVLPKPYSWG